MHEYRNVQTGATVMVADDVRISGDNWEETVLEDDLEEKSDLDNAAHPAKNSSKSSAATKKQK